MNATALRATADETERWGRAVVTGRSLGFCQLGDGRPGREWAHRVARGRGGSWAPVKDGGFNGRSVKPGHPHQGAVLAYLRAHPEVTSCAS